MPTYPLTLAAANGPVSFTSALTRAVRLSSRTASTSSALAEMSSVGSVSLAKPTWPPTPILPPPISPLNRSMRRSLLANASRAWKSRIGGHGDVVGAGGGDVQLRAAAEGRLFNGAADLDVRGHVALDVADRLGDARQETQAGARQLDRQVDGRFGIELLAGGDGVEVQRHVALDGQRRDLRLAHDSVEVEAVVLEREVHVGVGGAERGRLRLRNERAASFTSAAIFDRLPCASIWSCTVPCAGGWPSCPCRCCRTAFRA